MMIIVNRSEDLITGSYNGKSFSISYDEQKYIAMMAIAKNAARVETVAELQELVKQFEPLTKESYKELVETKSPYIVVNKHTNKFYLRYGDKVSSKALPQVFVDKIIKSVEKNIDILPLVKCWVRFLRNPHYTDSKAKLFADYILAPYTNTQLKVQLMNDEGFSDKVATERATETQVSITMEGLLVGYKVVEEITKIFKKSPDGQEVRLEEAYEWSVDPFSGARIYTPPEFAEQRTYQPPIMQQGGDAFFCGTVKGHIVRVGEVIALEDWKQVDTSDWTAGRPGLHVGGLRYIEGYQKDKTVTLNVFIDPMDIGAIVGLGSGNDGAMRVKKYFVYSSFQGVNRAIYHSSTYAAKTDQEYKEMIEAAVKATQMKQEEVLNLLEEKKALAVADADTGDGGAKLSVDTVFGSK